jgi:FixJ family two-component response regulator
MGIAICATRIDGKDTPLPWSSEIPQPFTDKTVIVIVDDDRWIRRSLERLIKSVGLRVQSFESAEEFLNASRDTEMSCLVLDISLPGMSGLDLQQRLVTDSRQLPIIFITAHDEAPMKSRAFQFGAVAFLVKPFTDDNLLSALHAALGAAN